ncbi:hypothetical protein SNE40_011250 [Patella caerulea]|uniref:Uncharacterized protein n=1 Tax=Patella caerulea TaxID=87958 RepID=A0AAN8JL54_PATCE
MSSSSKEDIKDKTRLEKDTKKHSKKDTRSPKTSLKANPGKNSPKLSRGSWRKSSPIGSIHSSSGSDDGQPLSGDATDAKTSRRKSSPKQKVSLNLNSKNNPLNPQNAFKDILPGGKPNALCDSEDKRVGSSKSSEEETSEEETKKGTKPKTKTDIDEEFRQKIKRMDYNTVYMMAQRTRGPQQYKYRKILQEMYDEQNK